MAFTAQANGTSQNRQYTVSNVEVVDAEGYVPIYLTRDRKYIYAIGAGAVQGFAAEVGVNVLARSADDGVTWQTVWTQANSVYNVTGMFETNDGECLVSVSTTAASNNSGPCLIYKSSGWSVNQLTATWTLVFTTGPAIVIGKWNFNNECLGLGNSPIVVMSMYAGGTATTTNTTARSVVMSRDHGSTWFTIYDAYLDSLWPSQINMHIHAGAYDPWDDCYYITWGDGNNTSAGGHHLAGECNHAPVVTLGSISLGATTAMAASALFLAGDVGRSIIGGGSVNVGTALITAVTDSLNASVTNTGVFTSVTLSAYNYDFTGTPAATCTPSFAAQHGATVRLMLSVTGFRAADKGKSVRINGGLVMINNFVDSQTVDGYVTAPLNSAAAATSGNWELVSSFQFGRIDNISSFTEATQAEMVRIPRDTVYPMNSLSINQSVTQFTKCSVTPLAVILAGDSTANDWHVFPKRGYRTLGGGIAVQGAIYVGMNLWRNWSATRYEDWPMFGTKFPNQNSPRWTQVQLFCCDGFGFNWTEIWRDTSVPVATIASNGLAVTAGDYISSTGVGGTQITLLYLAKTTGTLSATNPSHTSGTVTNGTVDLEYKGRVQWALTQVFGPTLNNKLVGHYNQNTGLNTRGTTLWRATLNSPT